MVLTDLVHVRNLQRQLMSCPLAHRKLPALSRASTSQATGGTHGTAHCAPLYSMTAATCQLQA